MSSMLLKAGALLLFLGSLLTSTAQQTDSSQQKPLQEVVVRTFEQNRRLRDVPAAVNYINQQALQLYSPNALVSAVNNTPGIRMEERSPGSYRINIRGSSLRSPFGVRNVKVYYNNLPFTDPGGNTYLNAFGFYNVSDLEIIKGPGSSLYGAGTGGVILMEGIDSQAKPGLQAAYTAGSYGLQNIYGGITTGRQGSRNTVGFQHQQSDGYRSHTRMQRDVLSWSGIDKLSDRQVLTTTFMYSNLFYETPGALTLAEYNANPRQARPAAAGFPSSEQAHAQINQQLFFGGLSLRQSLNTHFSNTSSVYGSYTNFRNPTIRNYSINSEPHTGGRSVFTYQGQARETDITVDAGGELQQNFTNVSVYKTKGGSADSLQSIDDVHTMQYFLFAQLSLENRDWLFTASASFNNMDVRFRHFFPYINPADQTRNYNNQLAPRLSILKKFRSFSVYASFSKGFSPPSTAELLPSGSNINLALQAEQGSNYELGLRGTVLRRLYVDVNGFLFFLDQTIVQRRDLSGGDYYTNSGKTRQNGIDTYLSYPFLFASPKFSNSKVWISHSYHPFYYNQFKQLNTDYSGNHLPGEPLHSISSGITLENIEGLSATATYYFSSRIPLNDANTAWANSYQLAGLKLGYTRTVKAFSAQLFVGADNLLDEKYSLGNDINAAGGRYYNAAPGRNFYAGINIRGL